jgi:hypothetical protein
MPSTQPAVGGALPPGHPTVITQRPTTGPVASVGALKVTVKQGTKNGPSLAGHPATVDLYYQDQLLKTYEVKLDKTGNAMLKDVPVILPVRPLVRLVQGGVQYQTIGDPMDGYSPNQALEVTIYEATDKAPDWIVGVRQAMIIVEDGGLRIMEMLRVGNLSDKTWLGVPQPEGRRTTVWVALPDGIQQFQIEGSDKAFTRSADGKLKSVVPLMPGVSRMMFSYFIPAKNGQATATFTAPKDVQEMTVYAEEGVKVKAEGLRVIPPHDMGTGETKSQMFRGTDLKAGHVSKLTVQVPEKKEAVKK